MSLRTAALLKKPRPNTQAGGGTVPFYHRFSGIVRGPNSRAVFEAISAILVATLQTVNTQPDVIISNAPSATVDGTWNPVTQTGTPLSICGATGASLCLPSSVYAQPLKDYGSSNSTVAILNLWDYMNSWDALCNGTCSGPAASTTTPWYRDVAHPSQAGATAIAMIRLAAMGLPVPSMGAVNTLLPFTSASDTLNCTSFTSAQTFTTTAVLPPFTQVIGAGWQVNVNLSYTSGATPPAIVFQIKSGSNVLYQTLSSAVVSSLTAAGSSKRVQY